MSNLSQAALLLSVWVSAAAAQGRERPPLADSSALQIMRHAGKQAGGVWLQDIMRQAHGPQSQAKLDEIADSLMKRALDPAAAREMDPLIPRQHSAAYTRATTALSALVLAGSRGPFSGRPYAGAFDRLMVVHRGASSLLLRVQALRGMLGTPLHQRAVDYLSQVAESSDETAADAVNYLSQDARGASAGGAQPAPPERKASEAALHALVARGRVTERQAAEVLAFWSYKHPSRQP